MSEGQVQESGVSDAGTSASADTSVGTVGNDTLTGGAGNDSITISGNDSILGGNAPDAVTTLVASQLTALDASNAAPLPPPPVIQQVTVPEAVPLCVSVNAPDGSRHALVLDAVGNRISTDKAQCESVRDAALKLRPTCAAVIEYVDDETRSVYGL